MVVRAAAFSEMTAREFHDLIKIRVDVFVVEQACAYPELDGRDTELETRHLWLSNQGQIAATLRIVDDESVRRIGRVATDANHRHKGYAGQLMRYALRVADGPFVLDAQSYLHDWYAQFGFSQIGPEFIEDGIPHVPMRLE